MKKIIALVLMLTLCVSALAACGKEPAPTTEATQAPTEATEGNDDLVAAKEYLFTMYRKAPTTRVEDFEVVGAVVVDGVSYAVEWTADSDTVNIVPGENKMVLIDVDEKNREEVEFTLTATLKDDKGNTESVSFKQKVPASVVGMSYEEIVAAAYKLEEGVAMADSQSLFGKIVKIEDPYNEEYKNISVVIQVGELADQPILCYRLSGEGVENLKEGDEITVNGILKNYKGTIEFDKGCKFVGMGEHVDQSAVVNAAYKLEDGVSMPSASILKGVITEIKDAYNPEYKNLSVIIEVDGMTEQPILCYRLSGEGAENLAVGDEIAVVGMLKNYKGTIEFDKGCVLVPVDAFMDARLAVAAYALAEDTAMSAPATMTGVVTSIESEYNPEYKNVNLTITVGGLEDYKIVCFRMGGEGADTVAVGDTITVNGTLKNYKGTIEFDAGCTLVPAEG